MGALTEMTDFIDGVYKIELTFNYVDLLNIVSLTTIH